MIQCRQISSCDDDVSCQARTKGKCRRQIMHAGIYPHSHNSRICIVICIVISSCPCCTVQACLHQFMLRMQWLDRSAVYECFSCMREKSVDEWKVDVGERKRDVGLMSFGLGFGLVGWTCSFILVWLMSSCVLCCVLVCWLARWLSIRSHKCR